MFCGTWGSRMVRQNRSCWYLNNATNYLSHLVAISFTKPVSGSFFSFIASFYYLLILCFEFCHFPLCWFNCASVFSFALSILSFRSFNCLWLCRCISCKFFLALDFIFNSIIHKFAYKIINEFKEIILINFFFTFPYCLFPFLCLRRDFWSWLWGEGRRVSPSTSRFIFFSFELAINFLLYNFFSFRG